MDFAGGGEARYAIAHADNPAGVAYVLQHLRERVGQSQDIPMMECGAVLATHTGLGAIAVAVRRVGAGQSVP